MHHHVWHEIMTTDTTAATAFYTELFGWQATQSASMPDYTMLAVGDTGVGGVIATPAQAAQIPAHWVGYVAVANVDEAVAKAVQLGGQVIHPSTNVPNVGRFATLADPQGAVFAVWTSAQSEEHTPSEPSQGRFTWAELNSTDHQAVLPFYSELFGWQLTEQMPIPGGGVYQLLANEGTTFGGAMTVPTETSHWLRYVYVDDIQAAIKAITRLGGAITMGPNEIPGGEIMVRASDPHGAAFAVYGPA